MTNHAACRQWIEYQKQLRRTGPDHDSSIAVGYYGDKKWTEWVIRKLGSSTSDLGIRSCGEWPYHLPDAPADMTNQRLTNSTWGIWWETNKNKTQVEWIREGFSQRGIELHQPLTTNDIIALLKVAYTWHSSLQYNAQRWLRDSGFRPKNFDLNGVPPSDRDEVAKALVSYAFWYGLHWDDPGKLPILGEKADYVSLFREPCIERAPFKWLVHLVLLVMVTGGLLLFRFAARRKADSV